MPHREILHQTPLSRFSPVKRHTNINLVLPTQHNSIDVMMCCHHSVFVFFFHHSVLQSGAAESRAGCKSLPGTEIKQWCWTSGAWRRRSLRGREQSPLKSCFSLLSLPGCGIMEKPRLLPDHLKTQKTRSQNSSTGPCQSLQSWG